MNIYDIGQIYYWSTSTPGQATTTTAIYFIPFLYFLFFIFSLSFSALVILTYYYLVYKKK